MALLNSPVSLPSIFALLACFLLANHTCNAAPSHATSGNFVKVSDLPPPTTGILGLSRLIEPTYQYSKIRIYYPESLEAEPLDRVSYEADVTLSFRCLQSTKRIVIHINPLWELSTNISVTAGNATVKELFFNPQDETLIVDMNVNLQANSTGNIHLVSAKHVIDEDDRFGIQAFNSTSEDTGESIITVGLSPKPKSIRRFVPCFDDSSIQYRGYWHVHVASGLHPTAITLSTGELEGVTYGCFSEKPEANYSQYGYQHAVMAAEATTFRVIPFAWYQEGEHSDIFLPPSNNCH